MPSEKAIYKFLVLSGLVMILTNCSVEKNTGTTRFYHGLTSRFNIYFNGYESYKAGLSKISNGYNDDYAELLRVFEHSDPSTASLCSSDMDKAIQKASKLISLKSISSKPEFKTKRDLSQKEKQLLEQKEYNEWVDDSYLLIGKARFYKHEFIEAASVFNHSIAEANDPAIKTESAVWLARINSETRNYNESYRILNELEVTPSSSRSFKAIYYTTMADLFIKQKRYSEAIDPLSRSLEYLSGKRTKYRLTYLLAQLYENTGDAGKATSLYREVARMNPPYDVEFNARINIAGVFDSNSGNPQEIKKELEKMLKDSKNKDYQDQIYFALGNMAMKEGDEAKALEYYKKSASSLSRNQNQKGRSYLALASHFYDKPDYMEAGRYYDSAVYFLDQKHPDYLELKTKSQNLNSLVAQLTVIQTEDSLQKVAAMSEQERNAFISGIIDKIVSDEREGRTSEYADRYNLGQYYENERRFQENINQEGKWYFYNQSALTFGRTEFRRRWGERRLEDNWRRSNKARVAVQQIAANGDVESKVVSDTTDTVMDYKKPEFYIKNLPLNDSLLAISNEKIAVAYLNAGKVYAEKIDDQAQAAESFESIIKRYPEHELITEALYNLYKVYQDDNNQKSETYRQRLLEKYPESEFSKILSDPDYYNKKMAELKLVESLYQSAYNAYILENFVEATALCDDALNKHRQDALVPKFLLLRAYSLAGMGDERSFRAELSNLIKLWPGTEESKKAGELIGYLNQRLPELKVEEEKVIAAELYIADFTAPYIFSLIILDRTFNINQASFDVISFNIDNYTNKNYRTEGTLVDDKYIMITVSGFSNNQEAWDYYTNFSISQIIRNPSDVVIMSFLINNANQEVLKKDKNPERYFLFFNENYLKGDIKR
ncbi:MAG TPA: tetratricopeptide repeat protein [Bacteroidales bacterium]|nr:tetratricopeptide repeat protein [Bacteroidales bacterium]